MDSLTRSRHLNCFNHCRSGQEQVEMIQIAKDKESKLQSTCNEIVFFLEGRVLFSFRNHPEQECMKGHILFIPAGERGGYVAHANTEVMVFRLQDNLQLCPGFRIEQLYGAKEIPAKETYEPQESVTTLEINSWLWQFLDLAGYYLKEGVKCKSYFDLKTKELLILLRSCYTQEQLHDFFYPVLSPDTAFSEYIRLNWNRYSTATELAASIPLSMRQFNKLFKRVFDTTPYKWMKERKAAHVLEELASTTKSYKQIAMECGFGTVQQFTKFCNTELGRTPTQVRNKEKV